MKITKGAFLKLKRNELKMTQEELAPLLNITKEHLSRIENDKYKPTMDLIEKASAILNFKIEDFVEKTKKMYWNSDSCPTVTSQIGVENPPSSLESINTEVLREIRELKDKIEETPAFPPNMFMPQFTYDQVKQIIEETVDKVSKAVDLKYKQMGLENNLPGTMNISEPYKNKVPLISGFAACGQPFTLTDNIIEDHIAYPDYCTDIPDLAITAKGNSMVECGIVSGSVCFIKKQIEVNSGDIAAICFYNGGEAYPVLKVVKKNNGSYHFYDARGEEVTFTDNFEIIGKVVGITTIPRKTFL